jgi:hypothetical protein
MAYKFQVGDVSRLKNYDIFLLTTKYFYGKMRTSNSDLNPIFDQEFPFFLMVFYFLFLACDLFAVH